MRLAVLLVLLAAGCTAAPAPSAPSEVANSETIDGIETFTVDDAGHREGDIEYDRSPPAGGPHAPQWQNCGFYAGEVRSENAVHSLEHGAVWITYRPGVDTEPLRHLAGDYVLVSRYPDQDAPVVASAWGVQLSLDGPDDERLVDFLETYVAGPQSPEPGAPCDGGIGEPMRSA